MKNIMLILGCALTMLSCTPQNERVSTIDNTLQKKVDSILQYKITEINAISSQAIVMEVETGEIKAMVGKGNSQASGLVRAATMLAALESGRVKLSDPVDVGEGVYMVQNKVLKDHNWHRGGYGEINALQTLMANSNIGNYLLTKRAFETDQAYFDMLDQFSYGQPANVFGLDSLKPAFLYTPKDNSWSKSDLAWSCIGYNQHISPIQMLTFYNAIANDGKMVKPMLYKGDTEVINPQIANKANIDSLQLAMVKVVNEGLGKPAQSDKVQVAGVSGGCQISKHEDNSDGKMKTEYSVEYCGYFPADNPKYSIIVSMNKIGLPASGSFMAGSVFSEIVNYMVDSEKTAEAGDVTSLTDSLPNKSLNDIRFARWTEKEWLDNEYIRTLRRHLDAYLNGEISDPHLDEYKKNIKGKFIIANIEPYLLGGAFIQFSFIEKPNKVFSVWVYSEVDEEKETISNYECRGLRLEEYESDFTKEEILQITSEHPELKLW
jgi:cell division protein FtsI (penicillin-binding protein 3)